MRFLLIFLFTVICTNAYPQVSQSERLKVFVDCSNTRCDLDYFRSEINIVDFLLDRVAADVHVLITSQRTGGGGVNYQMIFYGQNEISETKENISFTTGPNATDFERRDELLKHLKLGLVTFLVKNQDTEYLEINMKQSGTTPELPGRQTTEDPWNYWVFRIGADGSFNSDRNYQGLEFSGEISANRTTNNSKFDVELEYGRDYSVYQYTENNQEVKIEVNNNRYYLSNLLVFSIDDHWSYGYLASISSSTFSNNKRRISFQPSIEYSIFPYPEVNNKFWTIRYGIDYRHNSYYDTTIFNKAEESLFGHGIEVNVRFNQKWGNIRGGIDAHNYFHDWSLYNIRLFYRIEVRVTGGLFVFTNLEGGLIHDQIYLPKGQATEEEVLTRQRQLESSYSFWTNFGINYRFGSKLNNFVNPRFR